MGQLVDAYAKSSQSQSFGTTTTKPENEIQNQRKRRKRGNPPLSSCSCNYNSPVKAINTSISPYTYIRYPSMSPTWNCSFTCCANSSDGVNGRFAPLVEQEIHPFLVKAGVIPVASAYAGVAMLCPTNTSCYAYTDATTQIATVVNVPSLCSTCMKDTDYGTVYIQKLNNGSIFFAFDDLYTFTASPICQCKYTVVTVCIRLR